MIAFECSSCGKSLKVKDELAGKTVKCPACGRLVVVPQLAASVSPSPPESEPKVTPTANLQPGSPALPPKTHEQKESLSDAGAPTALGAGRSPARASASDLPSEVWERLEPILERFENAWQRGERSELDDYLTPTDPVEPSTEVQGYTS